MKNIKYYISGLFSILAVLFYTLPWSYAANRTALGFYIFAIFWFLIAWIVMLIQVIVGLVKREKNNPSWKHILYSAALIAISYAGIIILYQNDYIVTV